ncbi:uncharacterized protein LOC127085114 [Lathyrus oleraceus]|uniref:uncharacterized protein LOC127085114 n=1 Tax=Pisum sativum TaxID=3888 RepID=UPI0021D0DA2C|nr:uncharacterized protein LOC127085114 [Pisum sativum]
MEFLHHCLRISYTYLCLRTTTLKPSRGPQRKSFGVPHLAMNLTRHVPKIIIDTLHEVNVSQQGCFSHDRQSRNEHSKPVLQVKEHSARAPLLCPIFTPTMNEDFNRDNDDNSDYDPFISKWDDLCFHSVFYITIVCNYIHISIVLFRIALFIQLVCT